MTRTPTNAALARDLALAAWILVRLVLVLLLIERGGSFYYQAF